MEVVRTVPFMPDRFDTVAHTYDNGRLNFAPTLIKQTANFASLTKESTVLDIGCGPGTLANRFAAFAGDVLGVDPSAKMIETARRVAPENVRYVQGSSYDMSFIDKPVDLVTFGRSFHWTDRDATLAELDKHVTPDGCIALFNETPIGGKNEEHAWWRDISAYFKDVGKKYKGDDQRFGAHWERNEFPLSRSAFNDIRYRGVLRTHEWSFSKIMKLGLSFSFSSEEVIGDRLPEFRKGLKAVLKPHGPGPWYTLNHHKVLLARRPQD